MIFNLNQRFNSNDSSSSISMNQVDIGKQKSLKCLLLFPHTGSTLSSLSQDYKFDTWTSIERQLNKRDNCVEFDIVVDGGDE